MLHDATGQFVGRRDADGLHGADSADPGQFLQRFLHQCRQRSVFVQRELPIHSFHWNRILSDNPSKVRIPVRKIRFAHWKNRNEQAMFQRQRGGNVAELLNFLEGALKLSQQESHVKIRVLREFDTCVGPRI